MNNVRILILALLLVLVIIDDLIRTYSYYKKLDANQKKQFWKENGIVGAISIVAWSIIWYGFIDVTDIPLLCFLILISAFATVFFIRGRHIRFHTCNENTKL